VTKQYTSHLCTFLGREQNLKILLPYIETALKADAVDHYWFIDMTRNRRDHEVVKHEYKKLNNKFPGRVHIYNSGSRSLIIDHPDEVKHHANNWGIFYKFLERFNDNDIIAKCDDDTYFIDTKTLRSAFDLRWYNKNPYIMVANTINNGISTYHQSKAGIFKDDKSAIYPSGGLTGPLFSHPEIAYSHHKQFTDDISSGLENINKYKLYKNIHFCNRVSINFIFMLGIDRHTLSTIERQDEYDISCKHPQMYDRTNMLIGDFIVAHHTYGVQEATMNRSNTYERYRQICNKLSTSTHEISHDTITGTVNKTTPIKLRGKYLMRAWVDKDSYIIKNPITKKYISLTHHLDIYSSVNYNKSQLSWSSDIKTSCILDIDIRNPECIYLHNNTSLISASKGTSINISAYMTPVFFQAQYNTCKMVIHNTAPGKYAIYNQRDTSYSLSPVYNTPDTVIKFTKKSSPFEWELIPLNEFNNTIISGEIIRPDASSKIINDESSATSIIPSLPNYNVAREWIWMVKDYIWEFIPVPDKVDIYQVKLVADDKDDMYLSYDNMKLLTDSTPDEWYYSNQPIKTLQHIPTGKYLNNIDDIWCISNIPTDLDINID
tara:strand:- start:2054 stop:3865 length:1812 start_codon:yes stop_codon:yes gene_type:complete